MIVELLFLLLRIVGALLFFSITVFVHELGHFLVARWRGMVVDRFAIGFGNPIWSKTIGGVEYAICPIPFGGYVQLPQLAPMEALEGRSGSDRESLPPCSITDRILAALGGPVFSFGFGVLLAVVLWIVGRPIPALLLSTQIGYVMEEGSARGYLKPGDVVRRIDGHPVDSFQGTQDNIIDAVIFSTGKTIRFDIERPVDGRMEPLTIDVPPGKDKVNDIRQVGIFAAEELVVREVLERSPAEKAGLRPGDRLLEAGHDGVFERIYTSAQLTEFIQDKEGEAVEVRIERDGVPLTLTAFPQRPKDIEQVFLGVAWRLPKVVNQHILPHILIGESVLKMKKTFSALANPASDIKPKHMSGPFGILYRIIDLLREMFQDPRVVIWFAIMLNVNLAILNMLPIPVLDGGHIVHAMIEGAIRRPLPASVMVGVQSTFAALLLCFILYLTYHDVTRGAKESWARHESKRKANLSIEFLPEPQTDPSRP